MGAGEIGPWFRVLAALVEIQVWFPALLWSLIPTCSSSFKGTDSWLLKTPELTCAYLNSDTYM